MVSYGQGVSVTVDSESIVTFVKSSAPSIARGDPGGIR